jgi:hypothetical protein
VALEGAAVWAIFGVAALTVLDPPFAVMFGFLYGCGYFLVRWAWKVRK